MMSRVQLEKIERAFEETVENLLIEGMMDADLVVIGLENVLRTLAESVAAVRER